MPRNRILLALAAVAVLMLCACAYKQTTAHTHEHFNQQSQSAPAAPAAAATAVVASPEVVEGHVQLMKSYNYAQDPEARIPDETDTFELCKTVPEDGSYSANSANMMACAKQIK